MLKTTKSFAVLAEADKGRIGFYIRTGASMRCDESGAPGLEWKSSNNLLDGFEQGTSYVRPLAQPRTLIVEEDADETRVRLKEVFAGSEQTVVLHLKISHRA